MPHVPDTVPGKRVTGAGARTEGREASRQTSEVGAVCRKAARTDLCGGRPVMGVPTAIARRTEVLTCLYRRRPSKVFAISTKTTRSLHEGPMVRIRFPPAESPSLNEN